MIVVQNCAFPDDGPVCAFGWFTL